MTDAALTPQSNGGAAPSRTERREAMRPQVLAVSADPEDRAEGASIKAAMNGLRPVGSPFKDE